MASKEAKTPSNILVIWDFDWSLINENSDYYPNERLLKDQSALDGKTLWATLDKESIGFTTYMDRYVWKAMFLDEKISRKTFEKSLSQIPVYPSNLSIVKSLHKHSSKSAPNLRVKPPFPPRPPLPRCPKTNDKKRDPPHDPFSPTNKQT